MIPWTLARSHLARAVQAGQPPDVIAGLRAEYKASRLEHQIREAVPELTGSQRAQLALVLLKEPAGGDDRAAG